MEQNKPMIYALATVIFGLMLCPLALGVAVGGIYSDSYPVEVYPGESKEIYFVLQNMAGGADGKDIKFKASVAEGAEVASLLDPSDEYLIPFGASDVRVNVLVKVPANAEIGKVYGAKISLNPVPIGNEEAGMVQLAIGLSRYFKVSVVEKPALPQKPLEEKGFNWILWGAVLIIVIAVVAVGIIYFVKKRK